MDKEREKKLYPEIKKAMQGAIANIKKQNPEAGAYLEAHVVFDDAAMTFMYTGDDRIKLMPLPFSDEQN